MVHKTLFEQMAILSHRGGVVGRAAKERGGKRKCSMVSGPSALLYPGWREREVYKYIASMEVCGDGHRRSHRWPIREGTKKEETGGDEISEHSFRGEGLTITNNGFITVAACA